MRYNKKFYGSIEAAKEELSKAIDVYHGMGYEVEVECDYNAPSNERYRLKVFKPVEEDL